MFFDSIMEAMQLPGASTRAFQSLFNAVVVVLPTAEREQANDAYLDVLAAETDRMGAEAQKALDEGA